MLQKLLEIEQSAPTVDQRYTMDALGEEIKSAVSAASMRAAYQRAGSVVDRYAQAPSQTPHVDTGRLGNIFGTVDSRQLLAAHRYLSRGYRDYSVSTRADGSLVSGRAYVLSLAGAIGMSHAEALRALVPGSSEYKRLQDILSKAAKGDQASYNAEFRDAGLEGVGDNYTRGVLGLADTLARLGQLGLITPNVDHDRFIRHLQDETGGVDALAASGDNVAMDALRVGSAAMSPATLFQKSSALGDVDTIGTRVVNFINDQVALTALTAGVGTAGKAIGGGLAAKLFSSTATKAAEKMAAGETISLVERAALAETAGAGKKAVTTIGKELSKSVLAQVAFDAPRVITGAQDVANTTGVTFGEGLSQSSKEWVRGYANMVMALTGSEIELTKDGQWKTVGGLWQRDPKEAFSRAAGAALLAFAMGHTAKNMLEVNRQKIAEKVFDVTGLELDKDSKFTRNLSDLARKINAMPEDKRAAAIESVNSILQSHDALASAKGRLGLLGATVDETGGGLAGQEVASFDPESRVAAFSPVAGAYDVTHEVAHAAEKPLGITSEDMGGLSPSEIHRLRQITYNDVLAGKGDERSNSAPNRMQQGMYAEYFSGLAKRDGKFVDPSTLTEADFNTASKDELARFWIDRIMSDPKILERNSGLAGTVRKLLRGQDVPDKLAAIIARSDARPEVTLAVQGVPDHVKSKGRLAEDTFAQWAADRRAEYETNPHLDDRALAKTRDLIAEIDDKTKSFTPSGSGGWRKRMEAYRRRLEDSLANNSPLEEIGGGVEWRGKTREALSAVDHALETTEAPKYSIQELTVLRDELVRSIQQGEAHPLVADLMKKEAAKAKAKATREAKKAAKGQKAVNYDYTPGQQFRVTHGRLAEADSLLADLASLRAAPNTLKRTLKLIGGQPGFANLEPTPEAYAGRMARNIRWLYDHMPEAFRKRSGEWYIGYNRVATALSDRYSVPFEKAVGVIATLSPQSEWYNNVTLAERVMDVYEHQQAHDWDSKMSNWASGGQAGLFDDADKGGKVPVDVLSRIEGKPLGALTSPVDKAWWIRAYSEAHHPKEYRALTPDGEVIRGKAGEVRWQTSSNVAKAVEILEARSVEDISPYLGKSHKVRDFYNSGADPEKAQGTIDTHQVNASFLMPMGSGADLVKITRRVPGPEGVNGVYALQKEAVRLAAEEAGVPMRAMQSVPWEVVRMLFPQKFKTKENFDLASAVWEGVGKGEVPEDAARETILAMAGAPKTIPDWATAAHTVPFREGSTFKEQAARSLYAKDFSRPAWVNKAALEHFIPFEADASYTGMHPEVPSIKELPYEQAKAVTDRVARGIVDKAVEIVGGVYVKEAKAAQGAWAGDYNPNVIFTVVGPEDKARAVAFTASYLGGQGGVLRVRLDQGDRPGFLLQRDGQPVSKHELAQVFGAKAEMALTDGDINGVTGTWLFNLDDPDAVRATLESSQAVRDLGIEVSEFTHDPEYTEPKPREGESLSDAVRRDYLDKIADLAGDATAERVRRGAQQTTGIYREALADIAPESLAGYDKDQGYMTLTHYGVESGLMETDPARQGSGPSANRYDKEPGGVRGTWFYPPGVTPERAVVNDTSTRYKARVKTADIYDLASDPDGLLSGAEGYGRAKLDNAYRAISEAGYKGAMAPSEPEGPVDRVFMFEKTPVYEVPHDGPFQKGMTTAQMAMDFSRPSTKGGKPVTIPPKEPVAEATVEQAPQAQDTAPPPMSDREILLTAKRGSDARPQEGGKGMPGSTADTSSAPEGVTWANKTYRSVDEARMAAYLLRNESIKDAYTEALKSGRGHSQIDVFRYVQALEDIKAHTKKLQSEMSEAEAAGNPARRAELESRLSDVLDREIELRQLHMDAGSETARALAARGAVAQMVTGSAARDLRLAKGAAKRKLTSTEGRQVTGQSRVVETLQEQVKAEQLTRLQSAIERIKGAGPDLFSRRITLEDIKGCRK